MALRFRKSIKLAPGVRWNISGSGSSWTLGPRGASIGIGKRGIHLNSGIPGTGLSSRSLLSGSSQASKVQSKQLAPVTTTVSMSCSIADDGTLQFTDKSGAQVAEHLVEIAKKQNRDSILNLIQRKCDEINDNIDALGRLHHDTPDPKPRRFITTTYSEPKPKPQPERSLGFFDRLIPSRRSKIEVENRDAAIRHCNDVSAWETANAAFDRQIAKRRELVETLIYMDSSAMENFLEEKLGEIVWPRETTVTLDILDAGKLIALDVDLPELEDMPSRLAAVPARGLKLSVKELGITKVQKLYAEHVHGIVFRLVGEVFAALPATQQVIAAGYSQRRNPVTAQLSDDYLISVQIGRSEWSEINFSHLSNLEVTEALARFDIRRQMLKSGAMKSITPHRPEAGET